MAGEVAKNWPSGESDRVSALAPGTCRRNSAASSDVRRMCPSPNPSCE
jgi:hypothetical protein